jgi:hypothetical protein
VVHPLRPPPQGASRPLKKLEGRSVSERLLPSDWDAAAFRYPAASLGPDGSVAVNVELTGRTLQRRPYSDDLWIKARVEFVGDGEPSRFASAWLLAR